MKGLFSDPQRAKQRSPQLKDTERPKLLQVTREEVEVRLRKLLSLVGGTLGTGSQVFFPDEFVTPLK